MSVHVKCAVLEIGKKFIRGGFAGESSPSFALDVSLVDKAQDRTELFGFISDTFKKIFNTFLQANPKECKVLIIEKLTFEKFLRDTILTVLLHEFKVVGVSLQPSLYMGIVGSNYSTGIIVTIGESESLAIGFAHGRPLINTFRVEPVGIRDSIENLRARIKKTVGIEISLEIVRPLFERVACVAPDDEHIEVCDITVTPSEVISAEEFTISGRNRQSCLAGLISGEYTKDSGVDEGYGICGLILKTILACNADTRKYVAENIIICGGGSMIAGLPYAVCHKATEIISAVEQFRCLKPLLKSIPGERFYPAPCPFIRSSLIWIGGSLYGSLHSRNALFVSNSTTLEQYESYEQELLVCPDWMSLNPTDWKFIAPTGSLTILQAESQESNKPVDNKKMSPGTQSSKSSMLQVTNSGSMRRRVTTSHSIHQQQGYGLQSRRQSKTG